MITKTRFKEGDSVAHKDNLKNKMTVSTIYTETIEISTGIPKKDGKGFETKPKKIIKGIGCYWFGPEEDTNGVKQQHDYRYHSRDLVPWEIAVKGVEEVIKYLEN